MQFCSPAIRTAARTAGLASLCLCCAFAAPISGTVNFSGSVTDSGTNLDFTPPAGPPNGAFTISNLGNTGTFASISNTSGFILDLNVLTTPVGQSVSVPDFITFSALPNISITLNEIKPGDFAATDCFMAAAPGQTCTLPPGFGGTPPTQPNAIDLANTSTGSTAALSFSGTAIDSTTGDMSGVTGILTAQFSVPYQTLLADIASGMSVPTSYSATVTASPVPEPSTMGLVGGALIALSFLRIRYRRS